MTPFPASARENLTAREILDRVDDLFRGQSSRGRMSMTIRTEHWDRSLTLDFWSEGKDRSLFRILAPVKEKGTATLRVLDPANPWVAAKEKEKGGSPHGVTRLRY